MMWPIRGIDVGASGGSRGSCLENVQAASDATATTPATPRVRLLLMLSGIDIMAIYDFKNNEN
jgi:hypothetical protein